MAAIIVSLAIGFTLSPPRFWLNLTKVVKPNVKVGAELVETYECRSCHQIGGKGALKAPKLTRLAERSNPVDPIVLRLWLQNPKAVKTDTAMPNFHLSDSEIDAIIVYLNQQ